MAPCVIKQKHSITSDQRFSNYTSLYDESQCARDGSEFQSTASGMQSVVAIETT